VIRASIKGNLIRLVKRSIILNYFLADRANFYRRLRARKFGYSILQKEFAKISWSDRWKFLHYNPAKKRLEREPKTIPKTQGPRDTGADAAVYAADRRPTSGARLIFY
jgi:hypothetical protein